MLDLLEPTATSCARSCASNARTSAPACSAAGFTLLPGEHPIIPVMLGDAALASAHGRRGCSSTGVYVIGFSFPVVPTGPGAHPHADVGRALRPSDLDRAIAAFAEVGRELGVIA